MRNVDAGRGLGRRGTAGVLALALGLLASSPASAAPTYEMRRLETRLTDKEREYYRKPLAAAVEVIRASMAAQGRACKLSELFCPGGKIEGPGSAIATEEGLAPARMTVPLACDWPETGDRPEGLSLMIDVEAETRAKLRSAGDLLVRRPGSVLLQARSGGDHPPLVLVVDSGKPSEPGATLAIRFNRGRKAKDFALGLDDRALAATLAGLGPLPKPLPFEGREPAKPAGSKEARREAEREVIRALIPAVFGERPLIVVSEPSRVVVEVPEATRKAFLSSAPDLRPSLFGEFERMLAVGGAPAIPEKAKVIADSDSDKLFDADVHQGWKDFRKLYPGAPGILSLSRVGFSHDLQQAIVYLGWQADALVGHGGVYILARSESGWSILYSSTVWHS